jgi:hypothetical protein
MPSYMEKQKIRSIYFLVLIIDESLYGLKTFTARFHEHSSESLIRIGFKKNNDYPDL